MGVSTGTQIRFYTTDKEFVKKYYLEDRSDDYIYEGLVCNDDSEFSPENFGDFTEEQKEIMKVYFDEDSMSVTEGYANVIQNIQSAKKLLPIWNQIRSSIIQPFQQDLNSYHSQIITDYKLIKESVDNVDTPKDNQVPELTTLKSEYDFEDLLWRTIWKIDSVSKVIALLIVAKENDMLVEITAVDG